MSEKKNTVELKEKELNKVVGGGSGQATKRIYGETYTTLVTGRYYCGDQYPKDYASVLFVTDLMTGRFCCEGRREKLRIDSNNNWHTEFVINDHYTTDEMQAYYPYVLNIKP